MSCVEFVTAFKIDRFELRILGYELVMSPTQVGYLDESLVPAFEAHYVELVRVLDGFHVVQSSKVIIILFYVHVFGEPVLSVIKVSLGVSCIRDVLYKFGANAVLIERGFNFIDFYCIPLDSPALESTILSLTGSF